MHCTVVVCQLKTLCFHITTRNAHFWANSLKQKLWLKKLWFPPGIFATEMFQNLHYSPEKSGPFLPVSKNAPIIKVIQLSLLFYGALGLNINTAGPRQWDTTESQNRTLQIYGIYGSEGTTLNAHSLGEVFHWKIQTSIGLVLYYSLWQQKFVLSCVHSLKCLWRMMSWRSGCSRSIYFM